MTIKAIIAEDDEDFVKLIKPLIEPLIDGPLIVVHELKELWEALTQDVGIIWLDLTLKDTPSPRPVLTAIPIIKQYSPKATLIVASGWGEHREKAISVGADAFIEKSELKGFAQTAVHKLLTRAALVSMERGVDASFISQGVAKAVAQSVELR